MERSQTGLMRIICCSSVLLLLFLLAGRRCDARSEGKASLNVLVVGDWGRHGLYNQSEVASEMGKVAEKLDADFFISTGDNFYEDGLTGVEDPAFKDSFTDIYSAKSLQKPWYVVLGNHDYRGDALAQLSPSLKARDERWNCKRSFTVKYNICNNTFESTALQESQAESCGSVEIFFLDTTPFVKSYWKIPNEHTYDWRGVARRKRYIRRQVKELDRALGKSTATWKIVVGHHPVRSVGHHGDTPELQQHILPILEEHNVDLYVNGHDHCLEHIQSLSARLHYLTSGGGSKSWRGIDSKANMEGLQMYYDGQGFLSLEISASDLLATFYNLNGPFHRLTLVKAPAWVSAIS